MGAYYIPVNLDKKEYIEPHECGFGMKKSQFIFASPNLLTWLLMERWKGDRITIISDENDDDLMDLVRERYLNISEIVVRDFSVEYNMILRSDPYTWGTCEWRK